MTAKSPPRSAHVLPSPSSAAAVVLEAEFGAPFTFADPAGEADVRVTAVGWGYEVRLPVAVGDRVLVARGVVAGGGGDPVREQEWLTRWAGAVADRLRLAEQAAAAARDADAQAARVTRAHETLLGVDGAIRQARVHKGDNDPVGALEAALAALGAAAVCWVPARGPFSTRVVGEVDPDRLVQRLTRECPRPRPAAPVVLTDPSVLAVPVFDGQLLGWVAAVGRADRAPFRRADATGLLPFAALLELRFRSARRFADVRTLTVDLTRALAGALETRDGTAGHGERVARVAVELGREAGLPAAALSDLYLAGLVHDVGMVEVSDAVLRKPGPLTPDEAEQVRRHPAAGCELLAGVRAAEPLRAAVRHHHERYDGTGYPDRLAGDAVPQLARVLAVADGFDAMSTARPYRPALDPAEVDAELRRGSGTQWDPGLIDAYFQSRDRVRAAWRDD